MCCVMAPTVVVVMVMVVSCWRCWWSRIVDADVDVDIDVDVDSLARVGLVACRDCPGKPACVGAWFV